MQCVVCHNIQQEVVGESSTQNKKGLVMYIKDRGIITMSRHVAFEHSIVLKQYNTQRTTITTIATTH
jgi:hypothetical protein